MSRINVTVDNDRSIVIYDRSASDLRDLRQSDFEFSINPCGAGKERARFEMKRNGQVIRSHESLPFSAGALTKKSSLFQKAMEVNDESCVVRLKKSNSSINLDDYFN